MESKRHGRLTVPDVVIPRCDACSYDSDCRGLAVKCLMLVASVDINRPHLVGAHVFEMLYHALHVSTDPRTKHHAIQGICLLCR
jgi:hypothetical protein